MQKEKLNGTASADKYAQVRVKTDISQQTNEKKQDITSFKVYFNN